MMILKDKRGIYMNNLNITNEKIRKDLTFDYNGKEFLYSYGKDTLTNNNFTLLYENNKSKDEVLRIYDNNLTINEKYLDENVINKDFFEILKQNNLLDKTENYENFKSLNEKIDIYAKVGMSEISFSYNKNNFHYSMHQGKFGTSSICLNPINQIIYEKTTKDFVGTTINVIKYDSRYLNKKMFAALKNENLKDFRNQSYEDFCKNATDISKENKINKSFDER